MKKITDFLNLELYKANFCFSVIIKNAILNVDYTKIDILRLTNLLNDLNENQLSFFVSKDIISNVRNEQKGEILAILIKKIDKEDIKRIIFDVYCSGDNSCSNGLQVTSLDDSVKSALLDIGYITNRTKKIKHFNTTVSE